MGAKARVGRENRSAKRKVEETAINLHQRATMCVRGELCLLFFPFTQLVCGYKSHCPIKSVMENHEHVAM